MKRFLFGLVVALCVSGVSQACGPIFNGPIATAIRNALHPQASMQQQSCAATVGSQQPVPQMMPSSTVTTVVTTTQAPAFQTAPQQFQWGIAQQPHFQWGITLQSPITLTRNCSTGTCPLQAK